MKTSKKIGIGIIIVAVFSAAAFKLNDVKQNKKEETGLVNKAKSEMPVTTIVATYSDAAHKISYHGTFEPSCEVTVVSEAQGKVKEYSMEEGMFIPEGKIVAWIENDITSYQLETAEAAYQKAQDDLRRFENLSPGEAVSTQQLEEIKLAFKNAKSAYLTLKKQYENTFVKAPVSGTVSKRYVERGSFIAFGSPVFDLIDTRKMKFNAFFNASDLVQLKVGQKVKVTTDLYPGVSYEGIIKVISIKPDESKRYRVQAEVQNNLAQPLVSGIDGTINFAFNLDKKSIVIPRNCIVGSVVEPSVYVVENDMAKLRPVVISEINNGQAFISNGLSEGEQVVLSGQINIEDNTKVRVLSIQNQ